MPNPVQTDEVPWYWVFLPGGTVYAYKRTGFTTTVNNATSGAWYGFASTGATSADNIYWEAVVSPGTWTTDVIYKSLSNGGAVSTMLNTDWVNTYPTASDVTLVNAVSMRTTGTPTYNLKATASTTVSTIAKPTRCLWGVKSVTSTGSNRNYEIYALIVRRTA
jgi:hypothetical protein